MGRSDRSFDRGPAGREGGYASARRKGTDVLTVAVIVLVIVAAGIALWYRSRQVRDEPLPPERSTPEPGPPEDHDTTWNPVDRYDH
jgi:hypothetical protein